MEIIDLDNRKKQLKPKDLDTDVYCKPREFNVQLSLRNFNVLERYGNTHYQPKVIQK